LLWLLCWVPLLAWSGSGVAAIGMAVGVAIFFMAVLTTAFSTFLVILLAPTSHRLGQ